MPDDLTLRFEQVDGFLKANAVLMTRPRTCRPEPSWRLGRNHGARITTEHYLIEGWMGSGASIENWSVVLRAPCRRDCAIAVTESQHLSLSASQISAGSRPASMDPNDAS
jgi:hypothetical protein